MNRDIAELHPTVRKMALQTGIKFRNPNYRGKLIEGYRDFETCCMVWGKGRTPQHFKDIKLGSYSHYARPLEGKVSWLSHPNRSAHYKRIAIDMVVTPNLTQRVKDIWWDSAVAYHDAYSHLADIAIDLGFRSFKASYNVDAYHFELPLVMQPDTIGACQSFAVINALQKISAKWRRKTKEECFDAAMKIYKEIKRQKKKQHLSVSLEIAYKFGYIQGYLEFDKEDLDLESFKKQGIVIAQRYNLKLKRNKEKYLAEGMGIAAHAYCFDSYRDGVYYMRNSHYNHPTFEMTDLSQIEKIYIITA